MLRLKPTEIALTSADVEETLRHMARPVARPPRGVRGPRLRRGPQHSYSDAITQLGPIPILRPHQVEHLSSDLDEDDDESPQESHPYSQTSPETPPRASPARELQLPYRPAAREAPTSASPIEAQDDGSTPSPPKRHSRLPNLGLARINTPDDHSESLYPARLDRATDDFAEDMLDTTPRASGRSTAQLIPQTSGGASSPLRHSLSVSPPRQQDPIRIARGQETPRPATLPTVYLQGYFTSPGRYHFREHQVPHTEPRQRPNRSAHRSRTMSSTSDPAQLALAMGSGRVRLLPPQGLWTSPSSQAAPEGHQTPDDAQSSETGRPRSSFDERVRRAHRRIESMQGRYRGFFGRSRPDPPEHDTTPSAAAEQRASHRVSETSSNSSLPYSYYELPTSHNSGRDSSLGGASLPGAQYDGASCQVNSGAYYSIRPSQARSVGESRSRPADGLSPSPAIPYARGHSGLITAADHHDDNAANAVTRDLSSPLELLEQRAASELARISARSQYDEVEPRRQRMHMSEGIRQHSGNNAHRRSMHPGQRPVEMPSSRPLNHMPVRVPTPAMVPQTMRRTAPGGRAGQRSSENVPVGGSFHAAQVASRPPHPRGSRADFAANTASMRGGGTQSSPLPARYSLPPSPIQAYRRMMQRRASRSGRESVRRDSPIQALRHRQTSHPVESFTYRERHQPPPATFAISHREPDRGPHGNNRRPPIPARIASRRVSAQQLNQENSGDAEAELMREEMAAAGVRFAEDVAGLDIMDETPPRVGRFERHLIED